MQNVPKRPDAPPEPRRQGTTKLEQESDNTDQSHRHRNHEDVECLPLVQLHLGVEERSGYHGAATAELEFVP